MVEEHEDETHHRLPHPSRLGYYYRGSRFLLEAEQIELVVETVEFLHITSVLYHFYFVVKNIPIRYSMA